MYLVLGMQDCCSQCRIKIWSISKAGKTGCFECLRYKLTGLAMVFFIDVLSNKLCTSKRLSYIDVVHSQIVYAVILSAAHSQSPRTVDCKLPLLLLSLFAVIAPLQACDSAPLCDD